MWSLTMDEVHTAVTFTVYSYMSSICFCQFVTSYYIIYVIPISATTITYVLRSFFVNSCTLTFLYHFQTDNSLDCPQNDYRCSFESRPSLNLSCVRRKMEPKKGLVTDYTIIITAGINASTFHYSSTLKTSTPVSFFASMKKRNISRFSVH